MGLTAFLLIALKGSVALLIFAVGLDSRLQDLAYLTRRPGVMLRSLLAMYRRGASARTGRGEAPAAACWPGTRARGSGDFRWCAHAAAQIDATWQRGIRHFARHRQLAAGDRDRALVAPAARAALRRAWRRSIRPRWPVSSASRSSCRCCLASPCAGSCPTQARACPTRCSRSWASCFSACALAAPGDALAGGRRHPRPADPGARRIHACSALHRAPDRRSGPERSHRARGHLRDSARRRGHGGRGRHAGPSHRRADRGLHAGFGARDHSVHEVARSGDSGRAAAFTVMSTTYRRAGDER